MFGPLENQVAKTYYRGYSIIMFADETFGLAWETMSPIEKDMMLGIFATFEEVMACADELGAKSHTTPGKWEKVRKELQKEAAPSRKKRKGV